MLCLLPTKKIQMTITTPSETLELCLIVVSFVAICYGRTGSKLSCFTRHSNKKPIQVVVRFGSDAVKGG